MIRAHLRRIALLAAIALCVAFPASAQDASRNADTRDDLAQRIRLAVEEYNALRVESLNMKEQHQREMDEIDAQIARIENDLRETTSSLETEQASVKELSRNITAHTQRMEAAQDMLKKTSARSLVVAKNMKQRISTGIPYRRAERLSRIERIIAGLSASSVPSRREAIEDLWTFHVEELRLANSVDLWNEPVLVENGTRKKNAYQVRLGLIGQFFISEDGSFAGMAANEADNDWLTSLSGGQLKQLRSALAILQERGFPRLVPLPLRNGANDDALAEPSEEGEGRR